MLWPLSQSHQDRHTCTHAHTHTRTHAHTHTHTHTEHAIFNQLQSVCKASGPCHRSAAAASSAALGALPCWSSLVDWFEQVGYTPGDCCCQQASLKRRCCNSQAETTLHKQATSPLVPSCLVMNLFKTPLLLVLEIIPKDSKSPRYILHAHCCIWVLDHLSNVRGLTWSLSLSFPVLGSINSSLLSHCF